MRIALIVLSALLSACPVLAGEPPKPPAGGPDILNMQSFVRWWVLDRKPFVAAEGSASAAAPAVHNPKEGMTGPVNPYPPPADWTSVDVDDSDWARTPANETVCKVSDCYRRIGTLFLRGKFLVSDPAAVKSLTLTLKYKGGVIVHLNGKEVLRQDLPEGKVEFATPGKPYPEDAAVDANGKPFPKEPPELSAKRWRSVSAKALPVNALRKGPNVLAVEIHRSDYHPKDTGCSFYPGGFVELRLQGEGPGAVPNVSRPEGFRVWNLDRNDRATVQDYGDPCEPLRPVRIVGARNGFFSGQVVVGASQPLRGLKAEASEFKGAGTIPAASVMVRAVLPHSPIYGHAVWFDRLSSQMPAEVAVDKDRQWYTGSRMAVQPVHFTVAVPRDAKPGDYQGSVKISADGQQPVTVPVELRVADYLVPDPRDFRTFVGVYQSQVSSAMQYKVPEWSEEHWKLIEKSLELLAQVGNKAIHIPVVDRTQYGNDEGMVVWVKKEDGSYEHDFTAFDRYVQLAKKHLGPVDYVVLYIWHAGGWSDRGAKQQNTVTVVDKKTGTREHVQVPEFGTEESKKFWTPVLLALKERLAREGLDKGMCIGTLSDSTGPKQVFEMFNAIIPDLAWHRGCHSVGGTTGPYYLFGKTARVILHEHCYGMDMAHPESAKPLPAGMWKFRGIPATAYYRLQNLDYNSLQVYRTMGERALYMGKQGIGRIGLDFWEVLPKPVDDYNTVFNRWPFSSCGQREPSVYRMAWPGPAGAEPTVRFEALREGLQESEAVLILSQAMESPDRVGGELAGKCRKLLVERLWACWALPDLRWSHYNMKTNHSGWQDLNRRLFELAAEVDKKLGRK